MTFTHTGIRYSFAEDCLNYTFICSFILPLEILAQHVDNLVYSDR